MAKRGGPIGRRYMFPEDRKNGVKLFLEPQRDFFIEVVVVILIYTKIFTSLYLYLQRNPVAVDIGNFS